MKTLESFKNFFSRTVFQFLGQKFQKENGLKINQIFHDVIVCFTAK